MVMMMAMVCCGGHPSLLSSSSRFSTSLTNKIRKISLLSQEKKEVYTFDLCVLGVTELVCHSFFVAAVFFFFYQFASALRKDL